MGAGDRWGPPRAGAQGRAAGRAFGRFASSIRPRCQARSMARRRKKPRTTAFKVDPRVRASRVSEVPPELLLGVQCTEPSDWVIGLEGIHADGKSEPDVLFFVRRWSRVLYLDLAAERALGRRRAGPRAAGAGATAGRPDGRTAGRNRSGRTNPGCWTPSSRKRLPSRSPTWRSKPSAIGSLYVPPSLEVPHKGKLLGAEEVESSMPLADKVKKALPLVYGKPSLPDPLAHEFAALRRLPARPGASTQRRSVHSRQR